MYSGTGQWQVPRNEENFVWQLLLNLKSFKNKSDDSSNLRTRGTGWNCRTRNDGRYHNNENRQSNDVNLNRQIRRKAKRAGPGNRRNSISFREYSWLLSLAGSVGRHYYILNQLISLIKVISRPDNTRSDSWSCQAACRPVTQPCVNM